MTLEEILAQIESEEIKEAIVEKINDEKERGKEASRKKDKENLKLKENLKDLGWDKEKYSTIDEFKESRKEVEKTASDSKLTIASLNDKLDSLKNELQEERDKAESVKRKSKENKLTAELTSKIGDEFFGANYLIKSLITDGKVDIDESTNEIMFKDGGDYISFNKGLEKLKEENKGMLKVTQQSGTGDVGGNGVNQVDDDLMSGSSNEILDKLGL